ncbi:multiple cyclophane-containing RiPP AmcA [Streptomyces griseoviridis]|uniref:Uncharacterized protein n=1 Tax=Streptomyces griseoviridis TaxID=45398 RepID=A0A3Q9KXG9_STRGD|nr:multiple cyclophane-containing RiPP AmcA [Streptomyces griseoviridis]AZS86761.1 hypothetical protein ELQ87_22775 [Streptomyces griseoviridis]QCN86380.1 hypothetical protein DDJ31_16490 [Streptomyces griseoviridis]
MTLLEGLAASDAPVVMKLVGTHGAPAPSIAGTPWDNRPTWDNWNKNPAPFDNRPTWDNWNKR